MAVDLNLRRNNKSQATRDKSLSSPSSPLRHPRGQTRLPLPGQPRIVPRGEHNISRRDIHSDALKVMYRLIGAGYRAFLVGGGVRDLLLGKIPKDFDIGTDAKPEEVRALFRNSRTIGRRFRLVHVFFRGNVVFEVSTFRQAADEGTEDDLPGVVRDDNTYGDAETDALRRDLTINGLFYDLASFAVIDYVGGLEDLRKGVIRTIGDPELRFKQDPIRMIRAARHAARTGFVIEAGTFDAMCENAHLLRAASRPRVFEEMLREFRSGVARTSFELLKSAGMLQHLLTPIAKQAWEEPSVWERFCRRLSRLDSYALSAAELPPSVLFGSLFVDTVDIRHLVEPEGTVEPQLWKLFSALPFLPDIIPDEFADFRRWLQYARSGPLGGFLAGLLKPLGVSRKEVDVLERILTLRAMMWAMYTGDEQIQNLERRADFNSALALLDCTSDAEAARECLAFWKERQAEPKLGKQPSRRKRQRRRRGRAREMDKRHAD